MSDYYISPKAAFDATADAIRAKTGSQASITWGQDGFASAISSIVVPSGTYSIAENGTGIDVASYAYVDVSVPGSGGDDVSGKIIDGTISTPYYNSEVTYIKQGAFSNCSQLPAVEFPNVVSIAGQVFYGCTSLSEASFPKCSSASTGVFNGCTSLTKAYFPRLFSIPMMMFLGCTLLSEVYVSTFTTTIEANAFASCAIRVASFSQCKILSNYAFSNCKSLTTAYFPVLSSSTYNNMGAIGSGIFLNCTSLSDISFPTLQSITSKMFGNCYALSSVNFPSVRYISAEGFNSCTSLQYASFPSCSFVGQNAFAGCAALTDASFPVCEKTMGTAFTRCTSLQKVSFPKLYSVGNNTFLSCTALSKVLLSFSSDVTPSISSCVFSSCWNLRSLYLFGSKMYTLYSANAFTSTPISDYTASTGGVYGSIYVPESLYASYISATNWATYSDRFVSLTSAQISEVIAGW